MTQKDYIKRGNPKANKAPAKGKKPPKAAPSPAPVPVAKPLPFIAMAIALVVLGGFGYFLWSIKGAADNTAPPPPAINAQKPAKAKSAQAEQESQIPPPPEEKWTYMNELKNKEVEVEVAKLDKKGPFVMQCATFKDSRRAEAFRAQLALLGFESRIKVTKSSTGGFHHRVQLGPYEMNRDAQKARHKLSKHNINGCKIWLWS